eukprot:EG_transcript_17779
MLSKCQNDRAVRPPGLEDVQKDVFQGFSDLSVFCIPFKYENSQSSNNLEQPGNMLLSQSILETSTRCRHSKASKGMGLSPGIQITTWRWQLQCRKRGGQDWGVSCTFFYYFLISGGDRNPATCFGGQKHQVLAFPKGFNTGKKMPTHRGPRCNQNHPKQKTDFCAVVQRNTKKA